MPPGGDQISDDQGAPLKARAGAKKQVLLNANRTLQQAPLNAKSATKTGTAESEISR
jgi:hypothetical protein